MKEREESFSVVIIGNWNKYILNPSWVAKELFRNEEQLKVEFSLDLDLPNRYTDANVNVRIVPTNKSVTFFALNTDDNNLKLTEEMAKDLLDKLSYTPVTSFGINYGFTEDSSYMGLYELFNFMDKDELAEQEMELEASTIRRSFIIDDKQLNFTVKLQGDKLFFDFNFHYNVSDAVEAKEKLNDALLSNKETAMKILQDVYKLEIETMEGVKSE